MSCCQLAELANSKNLKLAECPTREMRQLAEWQNRRIFQFTEFTRKCWDGFSFIHFVLLNIEMQSNATICCCLINWTESGPLCELVNLRLTAFCELVHYVSSATWHTTTLVEPKNIINQVVRLRKSRRQISFETSANTLRSNRLCANNSQKNTYFIILSRLICL